MIAVAMAVTSVAAMVPAVGAPAMLDLDEAGRL
jgi:hypothetical protein